METAFLCVLVAVYTVADNKEVSILVGLDMTGPSNLNTNYHSSQAQILKREFWVGVYVLLWLQLYLMGQTRFARVCQHLPASLTSNSGSVQGISPWPTAVYRLHVISDYNDQQVWRLATSLCRRHVSSLVASCKRRSYCQAKDIIWSAVHPGHQALVLDQWARVGRQQFRRQLADNSRQLRTAAATGLKLCEHEDTWHCQDSCLAFLHQLPVTTILRRLTLSGTTDQTTH